MEAQTYKSAVLIALATFEGVLIIKPPHSSSPFAASELSS